MTWINPTVGLIEAWAEVTKDYFAFEDKALVKEALKDTALKMARAYAYEELKDIYDNVDPYGNDEETVYAVRARMEDLNDD